MIPLRLSLGLLAVLLMAASVSAQPTEYVPAEYVALVSTTSTRVPIPVDDIITVTLASGAWIKLRAVDIDYQHTAAYTNRIIIKPKVAMKMMDRASGRKYLNLIFDARFVATAWLEDVDFSEVENDFPVYWSWRHASIKVGVTLANYNKLHDGMSLFEVEEYLGNGQQKSSSSIGGYSGELYEWRGANGGTVIITFSNGRLFGRSQYGLE